MRGPNMKKIIFFLLCISFIMFTNCIEKNYPTLSETNQTDKLMKPKKPKPPQNEASVINLTVNGKCLIDNDVPYDIDIEDPITHPVLNLDELNFDFSYEILSSVDIQNVKIELIFDANINSVRDDLWLENSSVVFNDWDFEADGNNYSNILSWNGNIFNYEWFPIFNPLASYDYPDGYDDTYGDHYLITISAFSDAPSLMISKKAYIWIKNAESRSLELYVENIEITTDIVKNKVTPIATITLGEEVTGAYIYGYWEGLVNNSILRVGPSVDGVIQIAGGTFRKNLSGSISLSVSSIVHSEGVYNPYLNSQWVWPDRPVGSIDYN
jgi:hypothetical protein